MDSLLAPLECSRGLHYRYDVRLSVLDGLFMRESIKHKERVFIRWQP